MKKYFRKFKTDDPKLQQFIVDFSIYKLTDEYFIVPTNNEASEFLVERIDSCDISAREILEKIKEYGEGYLIAPKYFDSILNDIKFSTYSYNKHFDSGIDGMADNLSALEATSGAVVVCAGNNEEVKKYYLAPSQAEIIIPEIVAMHVTSSGKENDLPVYKLTPSQSRIIMKKFEEMNIPEANFEDLKPETTQLSDDVQDVIIVIEGKDKIHKYVLTPARAQSIIQQVIALSKETAVVTKGVSDVQEINLPDNMVAVLITENNEEKHYILTDEDAEEIKGILQKENQSFETQANIVKPQVDTQAAQLSGLADKDPAVQKANDVNRAMKKLFNSLSNPEEPYYYIALSKEYKKKGKNYESYYEPSWKKQKQSADPSHPAVSSVQESTVAGWLRRNFGLNFYKFKKNPVEEANMALGKKEKKQGGSKPEARSREPEVPQEKVTNRLPRIKSQEELEKEDELMMMPRSKEEREKSDKITREILEIEDKPKPIQVREPETKDSDAELLAKILKKVENL